MKISKKMLALVLTVAMLVSCMVFSFSADAAVTLMWENHFDNGTDSNWKTQYSTGSYASNSNVGNVAVLKTDEADPTNSYMSLKWTADDAETRQTGFMFFHEQATHNNASVRYGYDGVYKYTTSHAKGMFRPENKKYAIKLDYKLAGIREGATNGVCIKVGAGGWFNASYSGGMTEYLLNNSGKQAVVEVDTVYAKDVAKGWQTAVVYIDYVHTAATAADETACMYLYAGMTGFESDVLDEAELLIDNVMIYEYDAVTDFPAVNYYYGDALVGSSTGLPGAAYKAPALTGLPANCDYTYWADAECTVPATIPSVYPDASMNIYVTATPYLAADPWGFESETVNDSIASYGSPNYGAYLVSDDYAHSGSHSAKLECLGEGLATNNYSNKTQFMLKKGSGGVHHVDANKEYLISFWVLVPTNAPCDFQSNLWLVANNAKGDNYAYSSINMYNDQARIFRDNGSSYITVPKDGRWHHIVRKIDSARMKANASKTNGAAVMAGLSNLNPVEGLYVYIDDVDLICVDDLAANATSREQYLFGETVNNQLTHLHKHSAKKDDGIYTSVRLGATYTAGQTAGSIVLGGAELPLVERGIVVADATNAATLSVGTNKWKSSKTSGFDTVWETNGKELTYTLRLANISKTLVEAGDQYVYRSYFKINVPIYKESGGALTLADTISQTLTTYGETSTAFSFNDIYTDCTKAPGYAGGVWFD